MADRLQALMGEAESVCDVFPKMAERLAETLDDFRSALTSGEVVVTTFDNYNARCDHRDGVNCWHTDNPSPDCTRTNCPRLPR